MTSSASSTIEFERSNFICAATFLPDGKHVVGGGCDGQIRYWQAHDGREVGSMMDTGTAVLSLATSRDGKWVVSGMENGQVIVWDAAAHLKVNAFGAHPDTPVEVVDISPDGTCIATGSHDATAAVWSRETGTRLLGPLKHDDTLAAVKYAPDGRLLATATCGIHAVRIYDSQDGRFLIHCPVKVGSFDQSLAWARNSKHLFALSDGTIKCLDVSTGTVLVEWPIHSESDPRGIVLAGNGRFIMAGANSTVSFWDIVTRERIGPIIEHPDVLLSMALSSNYDLVTGGVRSAVLHSLRDILPPTYCDNIPCELEISPMTGGGATVEETVKSLLTDFRDLRVQHENSQTKIAMLENVVQELRAELTESRHRANEEKRTLSMAIESFRAELACTGRESDMKIARLRAAVRELDSPDDPPHKPTSRTTS